MHPQNNDTQRFYLKPLITEDLQHIAAWYEDIDDLAMVESKLPIPMNVKTLEKTWEQDIAQTEPRTCYIFSIYNDNNEPVGYTGLQDINYAYGSGVVFIYVKKEFRKQGIAIRSVSLVLDLAYYQLRLHRVATYVYSHNIPSIALISRCGFTDEGCMREACFFDGEYSDVKNVGQLAREWNEYRKTLSEQLGKTVTVAFGHNVDTRWCWPSQ